MRFFDRDADFAWVNLVARAILGLGIFFSGWSRFQRGFAEYATSVGAVPYAEWLGPSLLLAVATLVPAIEIVLGLLILAGFFTRPALLALTVVIIFVTVGAGASGLIAAVVDPAHSRPDGSGVFGPTGMSITFLKGFTYPLTALVLFLLVMPGESDRFAVDTLAGRHGDVEDATAESVAICLARFMVGFLWLVGGINKVFLWGAVAHAEKLFVVPYARTFLPEWSLWATGTVIPYLEFVFPILVIAGLWTRLSLYALGGILITVAFGHLLLTPQYMEGLEPFILTRLVLVAFVLLLPREKDVYSLDAVLRKRSSNPS